MTVGRIDVVKLNHLDEEVLRYGAEPLSVFVPNGVAVRAYFGRDDVVTAYTTFAKGDRLHEYFWTDRWYNVFALYAADSDRLKGWYCNLCRPTIITETEIIWRDVALDVWVAPDGTFQLLDEDEFEAIAAALKPGEYERVWSAVQELRRLATTGQLER